MTPLEMGIARHLSNPAAMTGRARRRAGIDAYPDYFVVVRSPSG
jgi:hypothetical protein